MLGGEGLRRLHLDLHLGVDLVDGLGGARQVELEDKVKERDLEISGLKKELRSMQRIQDG